MATTVLQRTEEKIAQRSDEKTGTVSL